MASSWNADFLDLVDALVAERVEYLIVGAFALAAHGVPRATGDIDFFVRPSPENAARVIRALRAFGAPLAAANVTEADFERPGVVYQMGITPRRIDLLTEISGLDFDQAFASRLDREVEGRHLLFIGRDALVQNKRASGRMKDLADVESLERLAKHS
jgi:hypothetical protein